VAYLLYGTLAAAYGLSVWAIISQRRRGERAPRRATAPEVAPREALAQQRASWARFPSWLWPGPRTGCTTRSRASA